MYPSYQADHKTCGHKEYTQPKQVNNCYEIVKEYRGGVTARLYQTVAFFFGSSLKQDWDVNDKVDRQIENIVNEIDATWYNNPYKPGIR